MMPYPKLIEPIVQNRHSLGNGDFLLPEMLYAAKNNSADKSSKIGRGVSAVDSFYSAYITFWLLRRNKSFNFSIPHQIRLPGK